MTEANTDYRQLLLELAIELANDPQVDLVTDERRIRLYACITRLAGTQALNSGQTEQCAVMFATDGKRNWYCTRPKRHHGSHQGVSFELVE